MSPFFLGTAPYIPYGIFETIEKYTLQTDDCKGAFAKCLDIHSLSELELLVQEGHTNDRLYWIESGLVRSFSGTDTDDITTGLYQEGDFFCAFSCFFFSKTLHGVYLRRRTHCFVFDWLCRFAAAFWPVPGSQRCIPWFVRAFVGSATCPYGFTSLSYARSAL